MSTNVLGNVLKHSGECPQTFRGMLLNIPGNVAKHSTEFCQTFGEMLPNNPGNVLKNSEECCQTFQGMSSNIPVDCCQNKMRSQGQSKISSCCFCVWCKSRDFGGRENPRFPCLNPVVECLPSDLLQAIVSYWAESHLEPCQTFRMVLLCKNNQRP